jgi:hypothetical protein
MQSKGVSEAAAARGNYSHLGQLIGYFLLKGVLI